MFIENIWRDWQKAMALWTAFNHLHGMLCTLCRKLLSGRGNFLVALVISFKEDSRQLILSHKIDMWLIVEQIQCSGHKTVFCDNETDCYGSSLWSADLYLRVTSPCLFMFRLFTITRFSRSLFYQRDIKVISISNNGLKWKYLLFLI